MSNEIIEVIPHEIIKEEPWNEPKKTKIAIEGYLASYCKEHNEPYTITEYTLEPGWDGTVIITPAFLGQNQWILLDVEGKVVMATVDKQKFVYEYIGTACGFSLGSPIEGDFICHKDTLVPYTINELQLNNFSITTR
jgi:hypothetical protein